MVSAERAFALLDRKPTVADRHDARPLGRAVGEISFSGVSFAYGDRLVLQDASFDIPAGSCVGVVGHTGSGKTTMINLLIRQFDPAEGQGQRMKDYIPIYRIRSQIDYCQCFDFPSKSPVADIGIFPILGL
jgi:ABC-type multidrug transport system fused ATPase/permease subunit